MENKLLSNFIFFQRRNDIWDNPVFDSLENYKINRERINALAIYLAWGFEKRYSLLSNGKQLYM